MKDLSAVWWWIALLLCVGMIFVVGGFRPSSPYGQVLNYAVNWAWAAVAVRAVVGIVRGDRTWWSLLYLLLVFMLPIIALATAEWWISRA